MASTTKELTILEHCRIAPPPDTVVDKSLPLTFFDLPWINFPPIHCLLFYKISDTDQIVVPNLKYSLSLALKHFYPLAGNLILYTSPTTSKPEIRYVDGDSVPLTIAECNSDFDYFAGRNLLDMGELLPLTPQLPSVTKLSESLLAPLLALQVTIFPNQGICVGSTNDHTVGDGSTMVRFRKAWASINKHGFEGPMLASSPPPFFDRSIIADPKGLLEIFRSQNKNMSLTPQHISPNPSDMVRASFLIGRSDIQSLKRTVSAQHAKLAHVSSFVVTCGYVWTCLAKSRASCGEETCDDEKEHFAFAINCRTRLDPPIPDTYFGNCIAPCFASVQGVRLLGEEGFLNGAKSIGEAINNFLHSEEGVLKDAEIWIPKFEGIKKERVYGVVGSPKFSLHDIDFGWGKPERFESGFNMSWSWSLNGSKDSEGGLEIGLSLPKNIMDAFTIIFANGLKD